MAIIHIKTKHHLSHEDAIARVEKIAQDLEKKLDAKYAWKGDALLFQRKGASGSIDVGKDTIEFKIKLGMMLAPIKGKIEKVIREKAHDVLHADEDQQLS